MTKLLKLGLVGALVLGVAAGASADGPACDAGAHDGGAHVRGERESERGAHRGFRVRHRMRAMMDRLQLDETQRGLAHEAIAATFREMRGAARPMEHAVRQRVMTQLFTRIDAILRPEQRVELDRMRAEVSARWARRDERREEHRREHDQRIPNTP